MAAGVDWTRQVRAVADAQLREGETLRGVYRAISPNPDPGSAFLSYPALPLLWLWRWASRKRQQQSVLQASGFPLSRRMLIAPTSQRVLIWSASKNFTPRSLVGAIDCTRLAGAASPTVGAGWRTVVISFVAGQPVSLKVSAQSLDRFIADLTVDTES